MNIASSFRLLAATSDSGVLLHDIIGGIAVAVCLIVAFVAYKRLGRGTGSDGGRRTVGGVYIVALFGLALAAVVVFFFVMPRATRQKGEATPTMGAGDKKLP